MSGIAGIWQLDGSKVELPSVERFIGAIAHRGPDGQSVLIDDDGSLALAHCRAAILHNGLPCDQPTRGAGNRYAITFDGEIYNSPELRVELAARGFQFRGGADDEVILAAFEHWGPDCLLHFNGVWSFAMWDRRRRSLFLARDHFGVKPLYMLSDHRRIAFASELKAFLFLDSFEPIANLNTVAARLAGDFGDEVLLRGIRSLPAAHWFEATPEGERCQRWWSTINHLVSVPADFSAQAEQFRELFFDACRLRLRGDVAKGTSLSGGLDSASVLCAAAAIRRESDRDKSQARRPHFAFIAGFPGTPQDETTYALKAAEHAAAVSIVRQIPAEDCHTDLDDFLYQFEEIGGLFGAPAWILYRDMRRRGILVSIDGHGADAALGGLAAHVMQALMRGGGLVSEPYRTLDLIDTLYSLRDPQQPGRPPNRILLAALTVPPVRSLARRMPTGLRRLGGLAGILRQYEDNSAASINYATDGTDKAIDALGPMSGALYRSLHGPPLRRLLRNFDAHSMGHAVEVRMPFLDWRLVRYAFSVPDRSKVAGGYTKRLLREAMRGVVPDLVRLRRPKVGYNAPVAQWLAGGLANWAWDALNDADFLRNELWDGPALLSLARLKRETHAPWHPQEAHRVLLAITAHWWLAHWIRRRGKS
jgi:asparagine synthase (glutamine-hydrolysing)